MRPLLILIEYEDIRVKGGKRERSRRFSHFCWPRRRVASISIGTMPITADDALSPSGNIRSFVPRCFGPASARCCCSFQKPWGVGLTHTTMACWNICTIRSSRETAPIMFSGRMLSNCNRNRKQRACQSKLGTSFLKDAVARPRFLKGVDAKPRI